MSETTPLSAAQHGWLLAVGMVAVAPLLPEQPAWVTAATLFLLGLRLYLLATQRPLPAGWLVNALALAGAGAVLLEFRTLFGQKPGIALLCLFLAAKLLETQRRRDAHGIIWLTWFLLLGRFFYDQGIAAALYALFATFLSLAALAALVGAPSAIAVPLRGVVPLFFQAMPLAALLFLLVPRVAGPLWSLPRDAHAAVSGLSAEMSPGRIAELARSPAIAFRARFDGPPPPRSQMYWRGPVLERFDGRSWRSAPPRRAAVAPDESRPAAPSIAYEVIVEPHHQRWLFALEWPRAFPADARLMRDFQLHAAQPVSERRRDRFVSTLAPRFAHADGESLAANLELPANSNPRAQALAASWRNLSPAERVDRALAFIARGGFVYTLRPPLLGEHAVDEFLFSTRRGFCEHFAAAFVVLMRAAGLPARVVTGYQGGTHNPIDDTWVIRQADAHAWAEVWLAEEGWRRVDPTALAAPERIEADLLAAVPADDPLPLMARVDSGWLRTLRHYGWAIQHGWNLWVLGYGPERQRQLISRLGMPVPDWRQLTAALIAGSALILLTLAFSLLRQRQRHDPASRLWRTFTRRMARKQLAPQPWEGPLAYARRLVGRMPTKAKEIERIATLYAGLRYGRLPPTALAELRRAIAAFRP